MNKINQIAIATQYSSKAKQVRENPEINTETPKLSQDLNRMSAFGLSQVNFRGGLFKLEPNDRLFVSAITTAFGLSAALVDKVKNVISDYLKSNNYKSMSDIGGEENIDQQCDLTEKINKVIKLEEEDYERLVSKVIDRCDEGDNYFPSDDEDELDIIGLLRSSSKKNSQKSKENDEKFISAIVNVFDLDKTEQEKFRNIIKERLAYYNLASLQNFGDNEENIIASISEKIEKEFDLTEDEGILLTSELINRSVLKDKYEPEITKLDLNYETLIRDNKAYGMIIQNYNLTVDEDCRLHLAMKRDAEKMGYDSIFKLFSNRNNFEQYVETNKVLDSTMSESDRINFIIDMYNAVDNLDSLVLASQVEDDLSANNFLKSCALTCMLDDEFDLSKNDMKNVKGYLIKEKIDFEDKNSILKMAYELTENKTLPDNGFDKIVKMIDKVNNLSLYELQDSNINYCQKLIDKR